MASNKSSSKPFTALRLNEEISDKLLVPRSGSDGATTIPGTPFIQDGLFYPEESGNVYRSNMVNTSNGGLIMMTQYSDMTNLGNITVWDDSSRDLWTFDKTAEKFKLRTKDFDFSKKATVTSTGSDSGPSRRKKVYKVYVTFRCNKRSSGVKLNYATNGSDTFPTDSSGTFQDTTYYTNAKGFDSYNAGTSSDDWITVALKPSSSINNIYSFALQFSFASPGHISELSATSAIGATEITLNGARASSANDYYNGMTIFFYKGPGYGQIRTITDYVGSSRVATLSSALTLEVNTSTNYDVGGIPSSFQINDISIIYREKNVK